MGCRVDDLYDRYAEELFRFLIPFFRGGDEPKDALQDVFVKIGRNPDCLDGVENPRAFLFTVARNVALDRLRRSSARKRAMHRFQAAPVLLYEAVPCPDQTSIRKGIEGALATLPEEQRSIVHLKLWGELTFREIAGVMGIPENTAASRFRYGIDKIRGELRPLYDEISEGE